MSPSEDQVLMARSDGIPMTTFAVDFLSSQRGIAWRCEDGLSLRNFLGVKLTESTPDHSSLSRVRDRLGVEVAEEVYAFVLKMTCDRKLISGTQVGVDATALEVNAAMKSIVRRDTGEAARHKVTGNGISLMKTLLILGTLFAGLAELSAAQQQEQPLVRVVDISVGETTQLELCNGQQVSVQLLSLRESRDPIRQAVRSAKVTVKVDGEEITLESGMYNLPRRVAGVQIDCSVTQGYNSNGTPSFWGLDKDARLRLWPADSPLLVPGSLIYPVDQRWFATRTWFDNEPVDGGTTISPKIYYHSGLDIGGSERQVRVIAATDAVVVSSGEDVLPEYLLKDGSIPKYGQGKSPVAPRADVVYLRDGRGWFYRYSHLHEINDSIRPGRVIKQGTEIGLLGKKGSSGGWSHLHFEIKSRQPSGKWGTQAGYAFLWEAYRNQYKPKLVANTRRKNFLMAGGAATLDGSKSYSATDSIQDYEWTFSDGTTASGPSVTRTYERPGVFSEILKVTDEAGNTDYDFAEVHVLDPKQPDLYVPRIHAAYWPTRANRVNAPITFKVRSFGSQDGNEVWDFDDGSPPVSVKSDGNAEQQAEDGYAITSHTYQQPGDYLVRVRRSRKDGVTATARLHVRVAAE